MRKEIRGGHIPGARSLPAKWLQYLDGPDMVEGKGLTPEDRVVVYGNDREETEAVAERFSRAGFADVALHHDFLHDWSNNATLPMERLPGYRHLVSAS